METKLDKYAQVGNQIIEFALSYDERQNEVILLLNELVDMPLEKSLPIILGILEDYQDQQIMIQDASTTFISKAIEEVVDILDTRYIPQWSETIPEGKEVTDALMLTQLLPKALADAAITPLAAAMFIMGDHDLIDLDVVPYRERCIAVLAYERLAIHTM